MSGLHDLTGAYVADALEDAEREQFEDHLRDCAACRDEVADLQETMARLGASHEVAPPPGLRASILDAIATTPMLEAQAPAEPGTGQHHEEPAPRQDPAPPSNVVSPAHGFGRTRRPVSTWLAAVAAVLAVALGGVAVWQQSQLQSIQSAETQRADLLAAPDLQVSPAPLDGGELTYLVSKERGEALLASTDLPDPGAGRSWQVWVMQDGVPVSGAVIDAGGRVQEWIRGVAGGEALAITNEPRGGSPAPTTDDIQALVEL